MEKKIVEGGLNQFEIIGEGFIPPINKYDTKPVEIVALLRNNETIENEITRKNEYNWVDSEPGKVAIVEPYNTLEKNKLFTFTIPIIVAEMPAQKTDLITELPIVGEINNLQIVLQNEGGTVTEYLCILFDLYIKPAA